MRAPGGAQEGSLPLRTVRVLDMSGQCRYIDSRAENGLTALHIAAAAGSLAGVRALLDGGASLMVRTVDLDMPSLLSLPAGVNAAASCRAPRPRRHPPGHAAGANFPRLQDWFTGVGWHAHLLGGGASLMVCTVDVDMPSRGSCRWTCPRVMAMLSSSRLCCRLLSSRETACSKHGQAPE